MKTNDIQEIEFKWKTSSRKDFSLFLEHAAQLNVNLGAEKKIYNHDYYLDTHDRLFGLTRTSCRLRQTHDRWELTLKVSSNLKKGMAVRREKTFRLPPFKTLKEALQYAEKGILRLMLNKKHLSVLFEIKNNRSERILTLPQKTQAQICFDDVELSHRQKKIHMYEIELEFLNGNLSSFKSFIRSINKKSNLKPAEISKVATALSAFHLKLPASISGIYVFSKYDRLSYAAHQNIKRHFEILTLKEPFVRVGLDDESVHDMRVSARRLRAVLKVFKNVLPSKTCQISRDLSWIGKKLGTVRDLNLHEAFLVAHTSSVLSKGNRSLEDYLRLIRTKTARAKKNLLAALNSDQYRKLLKSLKQLIRKTYFPQRHEWSVNHGFKNPLKKHLERTLQAANQLHPKIQDSVLHQFRICIKKLRYAFESFRPVLPENYNRIMKQAVIFQDLLGRHQDSCIRLKTLLTDLSEAKGQSLSASKTRKIFHPLIQTALKTRNETRRSFFAILKRWQKEARQYNF